MRIIVTDKELNQAKILEALQRKEVLQKTAAELMGKTPRTIRRKMKRFLAGGTKGIIHQSRGKPSGRRLDEETKEKILALAQTKYTDFGPTFMAEKLSELEGIIIGKEALRLILLKADIWKRKRKRSKHRKWREPKEHYGQMVQLDGSKHQWIEGSDEYWTLVKFVDDATKRVFMRFYESESYDSVVDLSIRYFNSIGLPASIYTDCGSVFRVNNANQNGDYITQYERALGELGIVIKHAFSPQAKGRIERSFQTDQDRLVKELRLRNIKTMEETNRFLEQEYIQRYNSKFGRPAKQSTDLHKKCVSPKLLEDVFATIDERKVTNDWTIRYKNRLLQIDSSRPAIVKPKDTVIVHERIDGSIFISIRKQELHFKEIYQEITTERVRREYHQHRPYKPPFDHPWRRVRACI